MSSDDAFGWLTGPEIARQVKAGNIIIDPFDPRQLNPNSYNYSLSPVLKRLTNEVIDIKGEDNYEEMLLSEEGTLLFPGECYLGCTTEVFGSPQFASLITGRSSIGRKFVTNHVTAGLIDVGFEGRITLEITVAKPTIVYPCIPFGQIFWFTLAGCINIYNGKYQRQVVPTQSLIYRDSHRKHSI